MRSRHGRRTFLRATAGVGASWAASSPVRAADDTVTLKLNVSTVDGDPVANRRIVARSRDEAYYQHTNEDGVFEAEVKAHDEYSLGLYRGSQRSPALDKVPYVDGLGSVSVGSRDTEESITVPEGHHVKIRVLDADGDPVTDAEPHFRADGWGTGPALSTDEDGYVVDPSADFVGAELAGEVEITITIPGGSDGEADKEYSDTFVVTEPTTIQLQEGEGFTAESGVSTGPETTATETTTTTTEPTTSTRTTAQETTATTSTTSTTTRDGSTKTPTTTTEPTTTSMAVDSNASTTRADAEALPERGFLSNGESAGEYEFLTDPLFLTVGGFVLSVLGIAQNLIRGR